MLGLINKMDCYAGAYPYALDTELLEQRNWVFHPYLELRRSGKLGKADESAMRDNLVAVGARLDKLLMGQAQRVPLDTRHAILWNSPLFTVYYETGGTDAREYLIANGMRAYLAIVGQNPDGRQVVTIGRTMDIVPFPVKKLMADFNRQEGFSGVGSGWGGSDLVGESDRATGTGLTWEKLTQIAIARLKKEGVWIDP